jgi:hypothetical protein
VGFSAFAVEHHDHDGEQTNDAKEHVEIKVLGGHEGLLVKGPTRENLVFIDSRYSFDKMKKKYFSPFYQNS